MDAADSIYKLSVDIEQIAYKIAHLEDEMAKMFAFIEEIKERENDSRRMVS